MVTGGAGAPAPPHSSSTVGAGGSGSSGRPGRSVSSGLGAAADRRGGPAALARGGGGDGGGAASGQAGVRAGSGEAPPSGCGCCRRRRLKDANLWVDVGDREDRLRRLRVLRGKALEGQRKRWREQGLSQRGVLWRRFKAWLAYCKDQCFSACALIEDPRTGLPNELLERFVFLEEVADGPHGKVFKARSRRAIMGEDFVAIRIRDKSLGQVIHLPLRRVASVIREEVVSRPPGISSFCRRLLSCLFERLRTFHSQSVVTYFGLYDNDEFFVEVMEWLDGGSLLAYLATRGEQLDEFTACTVFRRLITGLQYIHLRNLLHRNVRIVQIMLPDPDKPEEAKLGDLWCLDRTHKIGGTIVDRGMPVDWATVAPEVMKFGHWSEKSDTWAAGCVLFEMLHGHPPFGGRGEALAQRVLGAQPEYDDLFGSQLSPSAVDLLRKLLEPSPKLRLDAAQALGHRWLVEAGKPARLMAARRQERRLRCVRIFGRPPLCRKGLPAENLITNEAGTLNGGFCSYMGMTNVEIDFEVGERQDGHDYWVSAIVVSLWAKPENPRILTLQTCAREGSPWAEIAHGVVESEEATQAKLMVNKPLRYARLGFRSNFGGIFGICLRRVTFYGYPLRYFAVPARADECAYERGSAINVHTESLLETEVATEVHKTLQPFLELGRRVLNSNHRYRIYRDIFSGNPHHSSLVQLPPLEVMPGVILIAASLSLRYVTKCEPKAPPPRLRVFLVKLPYEDDRDQRSERLLLFHTGPLEPQGWGPDEIVKRGYSDLPQMFFDGLSMNAEDHLHVEVSFDNFAGYVHLPIDFGLRLYYLPEDGDDEADASARPEQEDDLADGDRPSLEPDAMNMRESASMRPHSSCGSAEGWNDEHLSSHAGSEIYERTLQKNMQDVHLKAHFGGAGPTSEQWGEQPPWRPMTEGDPPHGGVFWWHGGEGHGTSAPPSDRASTSAGLPSSRGDVEHGALAAARALQREDTDEWNARDGRRSEVTAAPVKKQRLGGAKSLAIEHSAMFRRIADESAAARVAQRQLKAEEERNRRLAEGVLPMVAGCAGPLWCQPPARQQPADSCGGRLAGAIVAGCAANPPSSERDGEAPDDLRVAACGGFAAALTGRCAADRAAGTS